MKLPIVGQAVDERFLSHRLRASSLAGIAGGVLAILLWYYRFLHNHVWSWDLFAVALTIVGVKLAVMAWYLLTD
jgi:protein-S-isoprenylcysteine O-methyltransferase Ste14